MEKTGREVWENVVDSIKRKHACPNILINEDLIGQPARVCTAKRTEICIIGKGI